MTGKKTAPISELFTVGHQPQVTLSAEQQQLFKSFQSNLISLLSHELRTPLMGILNALSALDEDGKPLGGLSTREALEMARSQASKLESSLSTVLDLAAWEAGALQVDLREGDFAELAASVFGQAAGAAQPLAQPVLLDAGRLGRALVRLRELLASLGQQTSAQKDVGHPLRLKVRFQDSAAAELWDFLWHEASVARAAHASLPLHVFAGVLQGEQGFLSRTREGLGAELHLVSQILAQHEAQFEAHRSGLQLDIKITLPAIEGRNRIIQLLRSRIWRPGLSEPAGVRIAVHASGPVGADGYALADGSGRWVRLSAPGAAASASGSVSCPADGTDAAQLLELALARAGAGAAGASV